MNSGKLARGEILSGWPKAVMDLKILLSEKSR